MLFCGEYFGSNMLARQLLAAKACPRWHLAPSEPWPVEPSWLNLMVSDGWRAYACLKIKMTDPSNLPRSFLLTPSKNAGKVS